LNSSGIIALNQFDKYLESRFTHNITINNPIYVIFFYEVRIDPNTKEMLCFWSPKANLKENYGKFLLHDKADTSVILRLFEFANESKLKRSV
jgi:hypothetical protein